MTKKKKSLFFHILISFAGILLLTLFLIGFTFRSTIGRAAQEMTFEIGTAQAKSIASNIKPFIISNNLGDSLENYLSTASKQYHANFFVYDDKGKLLNNNEISNNEKFKIASLSILNKKKGNPFFRGIRGIVVPIKNQSHLIGYLHYKPIIHFEKKFGRKFLRALLFIGIIILLLIIVVSKSIVRPLLQLQESVQKISSGELDHRVNIKAPKEFSDLALQFNLMTDRLTNLITIHREFLASVSHELRSPLTRIKIALQILLEKNHSAQDEQLLKSIMEDCDYSNDIIGELIEISKLELGNEPLTFSIVEVNDFINQTIDMFWEKHFSSGRTKDKQQIDFTPLTEKILVKIDVLQMRRVFFNVLDNACRYAPNSPKIDIYCKKTQKKLLIIIRDYGPGIPTSKQDKIFHIFKKKETKNQDNNDKKSGFGLGLYLTRQTLQRHGGNITSKTPQNRVGIKMIIELLLDDNLKVKT